MDYVELNSDQAREAINAKQRFQAWRAAADRERRYRGSMVWSQVNGSDYLVRAYYDENNVRRQKSLGRRDAETETIKATYDAERQVATASRKRLDEALDRQAGINRALGINRMPVIGARILGLLDRRGLMGGGLKVAGTNALYAYEAACGVLLDPEITATLDIDLLLDARRRLFLIGDADLSSSDLLDLLRLADRSFERTNQTFRAQNDDGYMVDLIKPLRNPPRTRERLSLGSADDLQASEIEGLVWLENAQPFEQTVIDARGYPVRVVAPDPRVFAIHKWWVSRSPSRQPDKRRRDSLQAQAVADLVKAYLPHLAFTTEELRVLPREIVDAALADLAA